ncbi:Serine/threonine-protein kinase PknD [Botrimarina colliarenosi]|uniref:Serine/threonine-protein kinase PknD n=1 Tax=Botrimarina colliarenosi TaxID=2528001 RepID=A0A5C6A9A3_9BACT|nr:protein kinase [Botrimarina colliarenosi]TWT96129.1 Serine/threonine-protein kinase PknD [Botrimarina colliarenosi]
MIHCPHCDAELTAETLKGSSDLFCPSCGEPLATDSDDFGLSSLGGSPADQTARPDAGGSSSSLGGSSFANSGFSELESASEDISGDEPRDATLQASDGEPSEEASDDDPHDVTIAFGERYDAGEESEDLLLLSDDEDEYADLAARDPGESLNATVDFGSFERLDREADDDSGADFTMALGGKEPTPRPDKPAPSDSDAPDLTQMVGRPGILDGGRPQPPSDATLPVDPNLLAAGLSDSGASGSSDSAGGDSAGDRTESPSTHAEGAGSSERDSATLAFDSERRSDRVSTPQPLDITGLSSGGTIPRGPLEEGRGSQLMKPGDSQIVGDESVRLRAFILAAPEGADPFGIDYALVGEAGKGGMGVVYKARQQSLNRLVAIKQIKSDLGASVSDCNKFISEAVITGQLEHPNIAPLHDLGLAADGLPFYAMKFVEGADWEDSIKGLSEEENLAILIQVAQAIAFAHSKNVLHRDLKPGNVRLGAFGEVLVMDWGLAARLDDGSEIQPAGTPIYMPPETALEYLDYAKGRVVGRKVESSRRRMPAGTYCDVYLLGALLFKIVTGRAPHRGKTTFECLKAAAKNEIVKVKRSSELLDIAYKAMATDPENRHTSALEFIEAIKAYQAHAQSIKIARRASQELRSAEKLVESPSADATEVYACYSRAQHGYQNALELWSENSKARRRLKRTLRSFGEAAYRNGDFDLALSLLDDPTGEDDALRASIVKDQKSRKSRLAWFKTLQYATAASLMVALGFIAYSVVLRQDAISLTADLEDKTKLVQQREAEATQLAAEAETQRGIAEEQTLIAAAKTDEAAAKTVEVERLSKLASSKAKAAEEATLLADEKQQEAADAIRLAEAKSQEAREQSYYAALGRIRAVLADNGVFAAWKEMQATQDSIPQERTDDPEWVSLSRRIDWRSEATELVGEAAAVGPTYAAVSSDGSTLVTAANAKGGRILLTVYREGVAAGPLTVEGPPITELAIDGAGRYAALVGGGLRLLDLQTSAPIEVIDAKQAGDAACVAFHPNRPELLVGDANSRVTSWRLEGATLRLNRTDPVVNAGSVTAVGYSPDGQQRFSVDDRGRIVLWRTQDSGTLDSRETYSHSEVASGSPHITGAVMSSDDRGRIAYGCADGAIYEVAGWWPAEDQPAIVIDEATGQQRPATASRLDGSGFLDARPTRLTATHAGAVEQIAYAEDESVLLSAGGDTLLVQRSPTRLEGEATKVERRYHDQRVLSLAVTGDGQAVSSDEAGRVVRWRVRVAPDQYAVDGEATSGVVAMRFEPGDGGAGTLAVADEAGFVRRWADVALPAQSVTQYAGHADNRDMQAWRIGGTDPQLLTVAADSRTVQDLDGVPRSVAIARACLWDGQTGLLRRSIDLGERRIVAYDDERRLLYAACAGRKIDARDSRAVAMAFSLDGGEPIPLWNEKARVSAIEPLHGQTPRGATVAVGLRDGQVFLWGAETGRIELVRSSFRPHWRPIRSLAYDPASKRLYSGDTVGLLAAWPMEGGDPTTTLLAAGASGVAPIVRLTPHDGKGVLAVQRRGSRLVTPILLDETLRTVATAGSALDSAIDAAIDPVTQQLVVLGEGTRASEIAFMQRGATSWTKQSSVASTEKLTGLTAEPEGLLVWGDGVVEWRPSDGGSYAVATRVTSRPRPLAFVSGADDNGLAALTTVGSIDAWDAAGDLVSQRPYGEGSRPTAIAMGERRDEWLVAQTTGSGATRLERWDAATRQSIGVVVDELPGVCVALASAGGKVFVALPDRVAIVPVGGGAPTEVDFPPTVGAPLAIAARPDGEGFALATESGALWIARRNAGAWRLAPADQAGVTSVAYTPAGDRLLTGVDSGRVLLLEVSGLSTDGVTARPLLSYAGHNDRVTRLDVAVTPAGTSTLVSGDASGRVIVRSL